MNRLSLSRSAIVGLLIIWTIYPRNALPECILRAEAKKPKLEVGLARSWDGSNLKAIVYKNRMKVMASQITCSNGTGTCFFEGQPIIGFRDNKPSRAVRLAPNRYIFTSLGSYFHLIGDHDSVAAASGFFRASGKCATLLRFIY